MNRELSEQARRKNSNEGRNNNEGRWSLVVASSTKHALSRAYLPVEKIDSVFHFLLRHLQGHLGVWLLRHLVFECLLYPIKSYNRVVCIDAREQ